MVPTGSFRLLLGNNAPLKQSYHLSPCPITPGHIFRFTDAYSVSALCCPSRASIATGRHPHQTGYWDNVLTYDGRVPSWMRRLRDAGQNVVGIGKLHFRSSRDDNGFSDEIAPMHIVDAVFLEETGTGRSEYQDYDEDITRQAVEWLRRRRRGREGPWTLVVSYASPHPPFRVPKRFTDLYPVHGAAKSVAFANKGASGRRWPQGSVLNYRYSFSSASSLGRWAPNGSCRTWSPGSSLEIHVLNA